MSGIWDPEGLLLEALVYVNLVAEEVYHLNLKRDFC